MERAYSRWKAFWQRAGVFSTTPRWSWGNAKMVGDTMNDGEIVVHGSTATPSAAPCAEAGYSSRGRGYRAGIHMKEFRKGAESGYRRCR
ncbi:MAG: hypothetical protein ACLT98_03915 [Eggerthellaceae bacterium]